MSNRTIVPVGATSLVCLFAATAVILTLEGCGSENSSEPDNAVPSNSESNGSTPGNTNAVDSVGDNGTGSQANTNAVNAGDGGNAGTTSNIETSALSTVNDFVYQLQNADPQAIGNTAFDLVVIDYSRDGSEGARYSAQEIQALKNSPGGPKIVLAYMSIGEAEDYRWYWQSRWDKNGDGVPDSGAPSWLGSSNPDWPGNYKVRYWEPAWQAVVFGSPNSYLDKIIATGFDGVYMDIIDAFEYWGPDGESGFNRGSAEREMVDFVKAIAHYARDVKGNTNFLVFPQNGEILGAHADYLAAVSGIGREDTWYLDNDPRSANIVAEVLAQLDMFRAAGKTVLCIDYPTKQSLIDDFYSKARAKGYIPYAAGRELDALTVNPGHEPD